MRIGELEQAVREGFANEAMKARVVSEGPVALSDVLNELEARKAARTLTGRITEIESELVVQRAANGWE